MSDQFSQLRRQMVSDDIQRRGIRNSRVLAAMEEVPREEFVAPIDTEAAYADCALPIESGQTISQPYTVAFMCARVDPQAEERVLEVGTGSGYGAAVLSRLAKHVDSVERIPELAESARQRLQRLGYENVTVHDGDGSQGLPTDSPYDVIVVTAAAPRLPPPYLEQLNEGGRIIIPVGGGSQQRMMLYTRRGDALLEESLGAFAFVPLLGRLGQHEGV